MKLTIREAFVLGMAITGYLSEYNTTLESQSILVGIAEQLEEEFELRIPIPTTWVPDNEIDV